MRDYPELLNMVVGNYYDSPKVIQAFLDKWGDSNPLSSGGRIPTGYEVNTIISKLVNSKSKYLLLNLLPKGLNIFVMRYVIQTMDIPYIKYVYDKLDDSRKEDFIKVARSNFRDYDEEKSNIVMNALKK